MMAKLIDYGKPFLGAVLLLVILHLSGLLGEVSYVTQAAAMKSGLLDADPDRSPKDAPDFDFNFAIKDLQGKKVPFELFKGKVVFLNLWATWCGPCRAEMPTIQKLYDGISKDSIVFVMLSLDKDQDKEKIVKYIHNKSYTFPVYQPSGYLSEQLNVRSIPTTFIISKEGKIVAREVGTTNFNTSKFRKFIEALIARN
jgi:thiol-disulfide isomerase/thioredoxin